MSTAEPKPRELVEGALRNMGYKPAEAKQRAAAVADSKRPLDVQLREALAAEPGKAVRPAKRQAEAPAVSARTADLMRDLKAMPAPVAGVAYARAAVPSRLSKGADQYLATLAEPVEPYPWINVDQDKLTRKQLADQDAWLARREAKHGPLRDRPYAEWEEHKRQLAARKVVRPERVSTESIVLGVLAAIAAYGWWSCAREKIAPQAAASPTGKPAGAGIRKG